MSLAASVSPSTSSQEARLSPAQRVTREIKAALERGVRPWIKPWDESGAGFVLPRRANGLAYRGVNVLALWAAAMERGYRSPYWFTFKQALALDACVRKGERSSFVVFYAEKQSPAAEVSADEDSEGGVRRILRGYCVFSADQIEGLPESFYAPPAPAPPLEGRETELIDLIERVPAFVRHGGTRAFYDPRADVVVLPERSAFVDFGSYLATRGHELGHWTRAPSRLDRDFGQKRFGDAGYALEELVAELCAAILGAVLGFPGEHVEDHASYIASWLKVLDASPAAFLSAAGKAQAAADYLLGFMGCAPDGKRQDETQPAIG